MRLFPSVYLLTGAAYGIHENVYAIRAQHSCILVDTGRNRSAMDRIARGLQYWGLDRYPISAVLLTHEHYEHAANAHLLVQQGAQLYASAEASEALAAGDDRVAGYAYPFEPPFEPVVVEHIVQDGVPFTIDGVTFTGFCVPGHSAGSVAYQTVMDGKTVLFTGDVIIPSLLCSTCNTGWLGAIDYERMALLDSIARLASMHTDALLAGHGEVCLREGQQLLHEAIVKARQALKHVAVYEPMPDRKE